MSGVLGAETLAHTFDVEIDRAGSVSAFSEFVEAERTLTATRVADTFGL